jgi:hypothetical protein
MTKLRTLKDLNWKSIGIHQQRGFEKIFNRYLWK